jgi:FkbM family methyltransferase
MYLVRLIKKIYTRLNRIRTSQKPFENYVLDINSRYDFETFQIIKQFLNKDSNTIDVGAHKGEILKRMITASPLGKHFAFEPLPELYKYLLNNFNKNAVVFPYALSDVNGKSNFNYVTTNPAYSGLIKRKYDRPENDKIIEVEVRKLDDIIPSECPVKFIKIDVEGAEFGVLKGGINILKKWKPLIIYEQGLGGSDIYGTEPNLFFDFMDNLGYKISLMEYYLLKKEPLSRDEYCHQFRKGYNYYFIAY